MPLHLLVQTLADVPEGDEWLSPGERAVLQRLRFVKRRTEWRLGRWTAKRLVAPLLDPACALDAVEIRAAADGAPTVWRDERLVPVTLSISHRDGLAFCAASRHRIVLGCDLEKVEPRSDAFVADYLTRAEQACVAAAPADGRARLANLVWTAKESALKALHTGLRADTRSVEVELAPGAGPAGWQPFTVHLRTYGGAFRGWSLADGGFVLSLVAAPAPDRPAPLSLPG